MIKNCRELSTKIEQRYNAILNCDYYEITTTVTLSGNRIWTATAKGPVDRLNTDIEDYHTRHMRKFHLEHPQD